MIQVPLWKNKTRSLFFRLLSSFLLIIILLLSFNAFTFTFFKTTIQQEIIKYNNLNLNSTVGKYENHLDIVKSTALGLFFDETVKSAYADSVSQDDGRFYSSADKVSKRLQALLLNRFLYVNNYILVFRDRQLVIDKNGIHPAESFFQRFYASPSYPLEFWQKQFESPEPYRLFPSAPFHEYQFNNKIPVGRLIPVIVRYQLAPGMYAAAFVDADQMFGAFHNSVSDRFLILDPDGTVITATDGAEKEEQLPPPCELADQGYLQRDGFYYFYQKGRESRYTYINVIPNHHIESQITRLNAILFILLGAAVAIGIAASVFLSWRFNNPVKKIVEDVLQLNAQPTSGSNIREFDLIRSGLDAILKTNADIHKDLAEKTKALEAYAFLDKLKMIQGASHPLPAPAFPPAPYRFLLFKVTYKQPSDWEADFREEKATRFILAYVREEIARAYPDAVTLQVEKDQILSIVFGGADISGVTACLDGMKPVFDTDRDCYYITVAVGECRTDHDKFTEAYSEVQERIRRRKLNEDMQVIVGDAPEERILVWSPAQEYEFYVNVQQGNEGHALQVLQRAIGGLRRKDAGADAFGRFAREVFEKVVSIAGNADPDVRWAEPYAEAWQRCHTIRQYEAWFERFLGEACDVIRRKKSESDPITDFVIRYVENHYHEDLSLSLIADKLNITNRYLSTYFKEKTGMNFIDYLHDVRVRKAIELLQHTNLKIQDITEKIGYQTINSFIRAFKKNTGLTPGEFRKQSSDE